ncbi:hypothetical protein ABFX02_11G027300 [Erythranthe guttata]
MVPSLPARILVGIPLDADESNELLSWAIGVLSRPGDTVVALHVIGAMPKKKRIDAAKHQKQIRHAKSFVISIVGEHFNTCQSNEVNLEARVGISSNAGIGLIEEAKTTLADYLIIGGKMNQTNRKRSSVSNYCFQNAPEGCSLALVRRRNQGLIKQEFDDENAFSSPRTVLDICEGDKDSQSNTDEESSNSGESKKSSFRAISSIFRLSYNRSTRKHSNALFANKQKQQPLLSCFSYQEIATTTKNFHIENLVGKGGYSEVYRGELSNGTIVAVKRLAKDNKSAANKEKEFLIELGIIGHVNHPNTAQLIGCCFENGLYLIFKFYPNGTLSSALHGQTNKSLDWPIRYRIILGIAKGLHYLHKCCKHRIIHRDIKASNVLLGPDYEPQISDFGLAKWLPSKWSHHAVVSIEGTFGYLAPEYFMHGIVDEKTDVFAFGILLLEIITGRRPIDPLRQNLLLWARPLMESGNLSELVDPRLGGRYDVDQLYRVVLTASYCVRQSSIWRPSMTEVLKMVTYGEDTAAEGGRGMNRRIPKFTSDEMDDYSMVFGYQLPSDFALDDI